MDAKTDEGTGVKYDSPASSVTFPRCKPIFQKAYPNPIANEAQVISIRTPRLTEKAGASSRKYFVHKTMAVAAKKAVTLEDLPCVSLGVTTQ